MNKSRNNVFIFYRSNDEVLSILENTKPALSYDVLISVGKAGNDMTLVQTKNYSSEIVGVWQSERITDFYFVFNDDATCISLYNNKNYEKDGKYQLSGTTLSRNWMKGKKPKYEDLEILEFNKDKVVFKDGNKEEIFLRIK